jgi:hypothetical protein
MAIFTRVKLDAKGRAQYRLDGHRDSTVRVGGKFFTGEAPDMIEISGEGVSTFAGKAKKVTLTKEERAALPKPTLAQRAAAAQARAAKLTAAAAAAAAASAPSM